MSRTLKGTRWPGESELITIAYNRQAQAGQSILSILWTPESPVTEVGGTSGIGTVPNEDGSAGPANCAASVRVSIPTNCPAGQYTITCTATMQSPTEVLVQWVKIQVGAIPT